VAVDPVHAQVAVDVAPDDGEGVLLDRRVDERAGDGDDREDRGEKQETPRAERRGAGSLGGGAGAHEWK